jgi:hypothetical protein
MFRFIALQKNGGVVGFVNEINYLATLLQD